MARTDPQINIRLAPQRRAILEAAAFVEEETVLGLVRPLVEDLVDRYAENPAVVKALQARTEHRAAKEGKVAHLHATKPNPTGSAS